MKNYTVKEWESLGHGKGRGEIPPSLVEQLAAQQSQSKVFPGKVFQDLRGELRAKGVVGILSAPDCSLEILPKIVELEYGDSDGEIRKKNGKIRKRLVDMLSVALGMKLETGMAAQIDWQRDTLLEILIQIFRIKLSEAVRRGIPRRYVHCEDDLRALRGSLNTVRQFTRHAANPAHLACRFDELSDDIALNRVMKATVVNLRNISRNSENLRHLRELEFVYADITHVPTAALAWDEVVIDRTNRAWRELFEMARLFLGRRYQTISSGEETGTSMLFRMNVLFEEFIGQIVKRVMADSDYEIETQGGDRHCLKTRDGNGGGVFKTRPDILIRKRGKRKVVLVIDTKWKRISGFPGDQNHNVSQGDVYQLMAYAQVYKASSVMLLYPHHNELDGKGGIHSSFFIDGVKKPILNFASVDVAVKSKKTQSRLHKMILDALRGAGNASTESDARPA